MRTIAVKSIVVMLLSAALPVAVAGQMTANKTGQNQAGKDRSTSHQPENAGTTTNSAAYLIGPADVLKVDVWKEPDASGSVMVRPDGKISLPLINDIQAAGLTPMKLAGNIANVLGKYISDPNVTVTVAATNSQRVYVVGEVNHPGPVNLLPNTTVLDALASAGGPGQFAHQKKIFILRMENGKQVRYRFNYRAAIKGDLSQNIPLKPGDTIVVP
jgi:polysaccharide biosynthesis/export protein